mgnify:FL=1
MAIKLTQGADAQIVTAATRAGLANTPKDYSNTFQNVVNSYEASMEASAEVWKEIGKLGTGIGMQLKQNAAEWNSTIEKIYDAGGTDALVDDVYDLRDELKSLGPFGGQFGDKETRKKRMQILSKRNKLFAEIDGWGEVLDQAALAAENGGLDERFFGSDLNNVEFVNAIIASNTNNKITDAGNYARVSRDPKTNNLIYTLYKQDGTEVKDNDGNPLTMSLAGFKKIIADAATDTNGVYSKAFNDLFTGAENAGATYGGEYDEYQSGKIRTALSNITRNPNEIRRGMRTTFGHTNTSFYDAITKGGNETAKYWSQMMETMTKSEGNKSELKAQGVLTGIKDTDNSGGISQDEVNAQWLTFQTNLLSGENEFSKNAFIDFVDNQMKDAYEFGARQKNKGSKNNNLNPFKPGSGKYVYPTDGSKKIYIPASVLNRRRRNVIDIVTNDKDGSVFVGELANNYTWNSKEGVWKSGDQTFTTFELMNDERLYAFGEDFENGLSSTGGESDSRISSDDVSTIKNLFTIKVPEGRSKNAINAILQKYGVSERAKAALAPGSNYKIKLGTETFYTDKPSDYTRLMDIINKLIQNAPVSQNTNTETQPIDTEEI